MGLFIVYKHISLVIFCSLLIHILFYWQVHNNRAQKQNWLHMVNNDNRPTTFFLMFIMCRKYRRKGRGTGKYGTSIPSIVDNRDKYTSFRRASRGCQLPLLVGIYSRASRSKHFARHNWYPCPRIPMRSIKSYNCYRHSCGFCQL